LHESSIQLDVLAVLKKNMTLKACDHKFC